MIRSLLAAMDAAPQRVLWSVFGVCVAMLGFGLYLQISQNLNPCPMCIVQRYALFLVAITAGLAGASTRKTLRIPFIVLLLISAGFGAFVAARQSWLQWYPPQVSACGRDFYGMIETFPLQRAIPMIFKGTGDCAKVDWTFLGGSIANWSFVCFVLISLLATVLLWRQARRA
ncbi:MAG: disulfide bond formation protein B [Rhodoferax sp.]|nr:disulfide bond formation protein B [Rhodoferax sp.]